MFKRKIYDKMLEWKRDSNGKTALLIEGHAVSGNQPWQKSSHERNMKVTS